MQADVTSDRSTARWAAVVGSPIAHSLSPVLHQAAYSGLGLHEWSYIKHELAAGQLEAYIAGLDGACAGLSVTMPCKREAAQLAASRCELTELLGVANTMVRGRRGGRDEWHAYNTDVAGISRALRERRCLRAVIIGAGATAASALAALAHRGTKDVTVAVRSPNKAEPLREIAAALGVSLSIAPLSGAVARAEVVVSTVPAGAAADIAANPNHGRLRSVMLDPEAVVLDVAYAPWPSGLAQLRAQQGASTISGRDMLVYQAVEQVELMTGLRPHSGWLFSALGVTQEGP